MSTSNYISSNLRFLRKLLGLSQEQFALKVGMNRGNIASYEKGNAEPSIEKLQRIAQYLEVDLKTFIEIDLSAKSKTSNSASFLATPPKTRTLAGVEETNVEIPDFSGWSDIVDGSSNNDTLKKDLLQISYNLERINNSLEVLVNVLERHMNKR